MNKLVITLTGEIIETNFDEWKEGLLAQIAGIQKVLKTDDDFDRAADQVKDLKKAEIELKKAKDSALQQADDIQKEFRPDQKGASQSKQ